ncbi:MAG: glutathione S-transferase [Gammaproteobacteria bacterium]|jgi:glutathione S-transferase
MNPILVIGNKNYSSWSLRPWLLLKVFDIPFEEIRIPLYLPGWKEKLMTYSPVCKVPVLKHNDVTCWDSLAICEYLADHYPNFDLWPNDVVSKAHARSISNEMHSGFFEIRNLLPMNCRLRTKYGQITPELQEDIRRIEEIWSDCRTRYGSDSDYLFGSFSIADAMYAPVVLRFSSYGIDVGDSSREYMEHILGLDAIKEWMKDASEEKEIIKSYERE